MKSIKPSSQNDDCEEIKSKLNDLYGLEYKKGKREEEGDLNFVYFSLDTANGTQSSMHFGQICQIAAQCEENRFNVCMLPTRGIAEDSYRKHGFKIVRQQLYHYGNPVEEVLSQEEGLRAFLEFLKRISRERHNIMLAGHNIFQLRYPNIIVRLMRKFGLMEQFQSLVVGFIDTILYFKEERKQKGNSLIDLVQEFISRDNPKIISAVDNVKKLRELVELFDISNDMLLSYAYDFDGYIKSMDLRYDLDHVVPTKDLNLIARAGISIQTLKDTYTHHRDVTNLLSGVLNEDAIQAINARLAHLIPLNAN